MKLHAPPHVLVAFQRALTAFVAMVRRFSALMDSDRLCAITAAGLIGQPHFSHVIWFLVIFAMSFPPLLS
jgi:hypothetical protein